MSSFLFLCVLGIVCFFFFFVFFFFGSFLAFLLRKMNDDRRQFWFGLFLILKFSIFETGENWFEWLTWLAFDWLHWLTDWLATLLWFFVAEHEQRLYKGLMNPLWGASAGKTVENKWRFMLPRRTEEMLCAMIYVCTAARSVYTPRSVPTQETRGCLSDVP